MSKFPTMPKQFERFIDHHWVKKVLPADENDIKKTKTVYCLETDKHCVASVSFEYGRAYVNCDKKGTYHFDLERLFEGRFDNNGYDWGWYKQLQEKNWVSSEVLLLILVLFNMFAELKVEEQYA
tara:strand:- start:166 stop:537 length:372 start_codon:yes stop_codon:yes gene_type:complete